MNASKNGWILCPSTRIPGKFYYFNVVTGEAAWSLNDIERRMASRGNFVQADKWHSYPEPLSPPEENTNTWNYPPGYRSFCQPMPSFGQAVFPRYTPNIEPYQQNSQWPQMPSMYPKPPMMMPMCEPMWPMNQNRPEIKKNFFQFENPNPNMYKNFNQLQNRPVFAPKMNHLNIFPMNNNFDKYAQMVSGKEPLAKKMRMQNDTNPFEIKINENSYEDLTKAFKNNMPQSHTCDCMRAKAKDKVNSWLTKSQENLSAFVQNEAKTNVFKNSMLSKSVEKLNDANDSEVSSTFSLKNSFVFPLRKSDKSDSNSMKNSEKGTNVSKVTPLINTKNVVKKSVESDIERNLSEEDLRHVLLAKRKRSFSEIQSQDAPKNTARKIKTSYPESQPKEEMPKKRVTFDLGVEDSCADDDLDDQNPEEYLDPDENAMPETDSSQPFYVVADLDVLLTDYKLIEDYVTSEKNCSLLIPSSVSRAVTSSAADVSLGRGLVLAARSLARLIANAPDYLTVQPEDKETLVSETEDPIIACCLQAFEEGVAVMLITNNEELYNKAVALQIDCYTVQEVIQFSATPKPAVSFDLKKIGNDVPKDKYTVSSAKNDYCHEIDEITSKMHVNCTRTQLFGNKNETTKVTNTNSAVKDTNEPIVVRKCSLGSLKFPEESDDSKNIFLNQINILKGKVDTDNCADFLGTASKISAEIEKLNLDDEIFPKISRALPSANKQNKENIVSINEKVVIEKGDISKNTESVARQKIQNVNIYNINELMKEFYVKTKEVEDRILIKIEPLVCHLTQILEDLFLDLLKTNLPEQEDSTKSPLQNLLIELKEVYLDHRTVLELADRLTEALECVYKYNKDHVVTSTSTLRPYEFMKILGYATLLVKSLLSVNPSNEQVRICEESLERLYLDVTQGSVCSSPRNALPCYLPRLSPPSPAHPRPDYVKNPAEVLQYLQKHFPEWTSYQLSDEAKENTTKKVAEEQGTKVVRTCGKNIGLLKLSSRKTMILECKAENNNGSAPKHEETHEPDIIKEKGIDKINDEKRDVPDKEKRNATSNNDKENENQNKENKKATKNNKKKAKPEMKEIDIEKREKTNQELLDMISDMVTCTDFAKSITKYYDIDNIIVKDIDKDLKLDIFDKNISKTKTDKMDNGEKDKVTPENKPNGIKNKYNLEIDASNDKNKQPLDLDVLDYSDIEGSTQPDSSSNSNDSDDENVCDVTTSNIKDLQEDVSPNNESQDSVDYADSGVESQVHSVIQLFLINLSQSFKELFGFIKIAVTELKLPASEDKKKYLHEKSNVALAYISQVINKLPHIIARESCDETAVIPKMLKSSSLANLDRRILKYRQVVNKCLEQARILETTIKIIQKISQDDFDLSSISDTSNKYINLFE